MLKFKKARGFTLIELLVVVSIIAVLVSILMPSLSRARQQARMVLCMSNLKQWSAIFSFYLADHEDSFMPGITSTGVWVEPLRYYYRDGGEEMRVCPTATKNQDEGGNGWFIAWDVVILPGVTDEVYRGSYGINNWVYNPPKNISSLWGHDTRYHWRRSSMRGSSRIPLFLDAHRWGGHPYDTDQPYGDPPPEVPNGNGMNRFCLDRHNGYVEVAFVDLHVESVSLKQLWKLRWSNNFDSSGFKGSWPGWMDHIPE